MELFIALALNWKHPYRPPSVAGGSVRHRVRVMVGVTGIGGVTLAGMFTGALGLGSNRGFLSQAGATISMTATAAA